ncbi:MAG: hypothetical protein H7Z19_15995, partial [Chitinophagaceae bacterium]|nr:hypothetical protein [Rubrivivax sp.]
RALAGELRMAGLTDRAGFFNTASADIAALAQATPSLFPTLAGLSGAQQRDALSQIAVMRGEHEMFSDWAGRALRWFASHP